MDGRYRDFLGAGWAYPVAIDPHSGDAELVRYEKDVRQAIRIILATAPGERAMRPRFGCGIHDLVFSDMGANSLFAVEALVREALVTYEPRIELLAVRIDPLNALDGQLLIAFEYRVRRTNQVDNLVYPFLFREAGPR